MSLLARIVRSLRARAGRLGARGERWGVGAGIMDPAAHVLPAFLGIGAQKAGTTWLHANLSRHPDLFLPEEKEIHYFDWNLDKPLRWYAEHFQWAGPRLPGEITPGYSTLDDEAVRYVAHLMPSARLILMLRHPVDRAWSQAVMNLVKRPNVPIEQVPEEAFIEHFDADRTVLRGDYPAIIERWTRVFSDEQLFIGFFEEIQLEPERLLANVMRHIGVDPPRSWEPYPVQSVIHRGAGHAMPERFRAHLSERYADDLVWLKSRFPDQTAQW
ncbi:MAG: sulfotransferase [Bacteroidota bacterium]